jgi:hypothetical protein
MQARNAEEERRQAMQRSFHRRVSFRATWVRAAF